MKVIVITKSTSENYFLRTKNINPKVGNLHKKSINLFPAPATFKLRKKIFAESTKFIVVSEPQSVKTFFKMLNPNFRKCAPIFFKVVPPIKNLKVRHQ